MGSVFKPKPPKNDVAEQQLAETKKQNEDLKAQNKARSRNARAGAGGYASDTAWKGRLGVSSQLDQTLSKNLGAK